MHLSTICQHYKQGLHSVARLIESLEMQIENLTLAQSSNLHTICLQRTVEDQKNQISRLSRTLQNKAQQLLDAQQLSYQLQVQIEKIREHEDQLKKRIREFEICLESDSVPPAKLDSHNSKSSAVARSALK